MGVVLVLVGCGSDRAPVSVEAAGSFVCEGVPREGAELTLGGAVKVDESGGSWATAAQTAFACRLVPTGNDSRSVSVIATRAAVDLPPSIDGLGSSEATLEAWAAQADAEPIDADASGEGFLLDSQKAMWLCGEVAVTVRFIGRSVKGRDSGADIEALLVSMLPWACQGEDPPKVTSD